MSISGVGSANSYIYKNVNKSNNRNKGAALFNQAENLFGSISQRVSEQSRSFSANDAYNRMTMSGFVIQFESAEISMYYRVRRILMCPRP